MALAFHRLGASALRGSFRIRPRRSIAPSRICSRPFHLSPFTRKDDDPKIPTFDPSEKLLGPESEPSPDADSQVAGSGSPETAADAVTAEQQRSTSTSARATFDAEDAKDDKSFQEASVYATPEEEAEMQALLDDPPPDKKEMVDQFKQYMENLEDRFAKQMEYERPNEIQDPSESRAAFKGGFMAMDEDNPQDEGDDEPFEGDDITSLAHGDLEQHRELREYARIAAWEMPMLAKYAKPFEPPTDSPLRFRYTSYMGESHPAENKVVLEFCTSDLPLSPAQRLKLVKLVGARYNPQTDIVKMSCEMFGTIAQNKRYLGDLVDTLMDTAKGKGEIEGAKDSFEDVPVDFRHVKWKREHKFPEAWKMTGARKKELEQSRAARAEKERLRIEEDRMADGMVAIEQSLRRPITEPVKVTTRRKQIK